MPSLNCERYASHEMHFSNSLIIHNVVTQPERLILVRWMSLETQWKTSWKPHVFGDDFKPVYKMFLNLHIQRARRTHEDEKLTELQYVYTSEQAYLLLTLNVTVSKYQNKQWQVPHKATPLHLLSEASIDRIKIQLLILFLDGTTYFTAFHTLW